MATYNAQSARDLDPTTPQEGVGLSWVPELNDAVREIKRVLRADHGAIEVTATYSISAADKVVMANASAGPILVTLPSLTGVCSTTISREVLVFKTDTSMNAVTVKGVDSQTINGQATFALSTRYSLARLIGHGGTNWYRVGDRLPFEAGDYIEARMSLEATANSVDTIITYLAGPRFVMTRPGTIRFKHLVNFSGLEAGKRGITRLYRFRSGVYSAVGSEHTLTGTAAASAVTPFSEDISGWLAGDVLHLAAIRDAQTANVRASISKVSINVGNPTYTAMADLD